MTKILLVDDMRNFLDLEISFLRRADCKVITAKDGLEAIKNAKAEKPDVILLDIEMPRLNGIEACRILKHDPETKSIPVVMVTTHEKRDECFRAGCTDYLRKPIDEDLFLKTVKKHVPGLKDRGEPRVRKSLLVEYTAGGKKVQAFLRDLSGTGAFVVTGDLLALKTRFPFELELPPEQGSKRLKIEAEVVRHEKDEEFGRRVSGMGLQFLKLDAKAKKAIAQVLEQTA